MEGNPYTELSAGQNLVIGTEIVYLSAATTTGGTIARNQLGSTAASHANNAPVYYLNGGINFRGVAVMDERTKAGRPLTESLKPAT